MSSQAGLPPILANFPLLDMENSEAAD
ncbi:hypothetical protein A2U01_0086994, partial [Trifolium medium]|nr:hypothetical protein [Trifolium medium]